MVMAQSALAWILVIAAGIALSASTILACCGRFVGLLNMVD